MPQIFADGARVELDTSISAEDVSLNVIQGGELFPIADYVGAGTLSQISPENWFKLVIQDDDGFEVVYCYSHSIGSNIFSNLRRGMDGTTARAFSTGAVVGLRPLAKDMGDLVSRAKTNTELLETKADKTGNIQGNAGTATKLESARALSISGGVTAAAKNFDGSMPVDLEVTAIDVSKANAGTLPVARGGTGTTTSTGTGKLVLDNSPALTGTPTAPTAAVGTNNTQVATTGFVATGLSGKSDTNHVHSVATTGSNGFMSSADKTKLDGIAAGAQVNVPTNLDRSPSATTVTISSSTGTSTTIPAATTTAAGVMTAADKTKLDGVAVGATANATDASLRDRSTHTGTQATSTISGLDTALSAKAPLNSPALTGVPTAPTATAGTNTTQLATTAFVQAVNASDTGSAATAVKLKTARAIGGVFFDGSADITLPGVNSVGTQNTTGSAATLTTARTINGTAFNGSANITTANWGTARNITLGSSTKSVNGSVNVSWTLPEIGAEPTLAAGTTAQYLRGDKTWQTLNKAAVGLSNVDNTSDANKPISTATATALANKVDKVAGKQLSTEDFTSAEKTKLAGLDAGGAVGDILLTSRTLSAPKWLPAKAGTYSKTAYPALGELFAPSTVAADPVTKLNTPATAGGGVNTCASFSPDGVYLIAAVGGNERSRLYKREGDTFTQMPALPNLPDLATNKVLFSPYGDYLVLSHTVSPYLTIYKRNGDVFTKLDSPSVLPGGSSNEMAFSPGNDYFAVAHGGSPNVTIYKRTGDTFTKLTNPAALPAGAGFGADFSQDGVHLAVAHTTSPFVTIYKRSGDTFTKLANPASLPGSNGRSAAFSPDGGHLAVAIESSPYIAIYKRVGDTFTKLANPATTPTGRGQQVAFSPDGNFLAIAHDDAGGVSGIRYTLYSRSGDTFTKVPDPAVPPAGSDGRGVAFWFGSAKYMERFMAISSWSYTDGLAIYRDGYPSDPYDEFTVPNCDSLLVTNVKAFIRAT